MGAGAPTQPGHGPGTKRRRGRPPAHRGGDTRAAIVATAQRLFGASGYADVSMEALAADCGLNPRALYYYFPSKRDLFEAATADALDRFGAEVAERVFTHTAIRERVDGYIDVYRHLHATAPHLVPFVGMVLVDAVAGEPHGGQSPASDAGAHLRTFLETLVDDAVAGDELEPDVDPAGARMVLEAIGMGVALASIGDADTFPAMLDVLQRLNRGSLYRSAPPPP